MVLQRYYNVNIMALCQVMGTYFFLYQLFIKSIKYNSGLAAITNLILSKRLIFKVSLPALMLYSEKIGKFEETRDNVSFRV